MAGLNHPIAGTTPILNDVWYHAAATFDGSSWRLYLNGNLEASADLGPGHLPQSSSIQHAGLATAMNSSGTPDGYFQGLMDEARIWNVARSDADLQAGMASEILAATVATATCASWNSRPPTT